jgi:glycosyltransferase involved in cell wall biosynthesis
VNKNKVVHAVTVSESLIFLKNYSMHMRNNDIEYIVSCNPDNAAESWCKKEGVVFLPVPMVRAPSLLNDFKSLYQCIRKLHNIKPLIVNAGTPKAGLIFMLSAWFLRIPHRIYHVRGYRHESLSGMRQKLQILIEKVCGILATEVLMESQSLEDYAVQKKLFNPKKMFSIGPGSSGIEVSNFNSNSNKRNNAQALKVGFLGRLIPRKGVEELVSAWRILEEKYTDISLIIAGESDVNQLLSHEFHQNLSNCKRVKSLGKIEYSQVPEFMRKIDLFVLPAHWEGFGNVLVEAAASGVPVISTYANGTKNAVNDFVNGSLVPVKDIDSLVRAIQMYIEVPELLSYHSKNGPYWASQFDRDLIASLFAEYYCALILKSNS